MTLADYQKTHADQLRSLFLKGSRAIVTGKKGFGKRTIVEAVSIDLGLTFIPVALDAPVRAVCRALLGHENLALSTCCEDGLLAQEGACVYLSGVENINPDFLPVLREIFLVHSRRSVGEGPYGTWIVAGINTDTTRSVLREIDPLVLTTPNIRFPESLVAHDLIQIAESIFVETEIVGELGEEAFTNLRLPYGGLVYLRKWILDAANIYEKVNLDSFFSAMRADILPFVEQLKYRGSSITYGEYLKWTTQFDPSIRPIMDHLIRMMVEKKYVMTEGDFHRAVDDIVRRSGLPRGHQVVLCEWQPFGKSGPVMTHRVKERGNWGGYAISIDLADDPDVWVNTLPNRKLPAILADDFVGTGDSISKVVPQIRLLLETCPKIQVFIMLVAGFAEGIQRIKCLETEFGERVKIIVGRLFYNSDTCFNEASELLKPDERFALDGFCDDFGDRVKTKCTRGYGDLGALIVFPESVPNTTLPAFWFDNKPKLWRPLFPASMIIDD
jgi:hypothetical protein